MKTERRLGNYALTFACTSCGVCCSGPEEGIVRVTVKEIRTLAKRFTMTVSAFKRQYIRKDGHIHRLIEKDNRDCIFLDDRKRICTVYEDRPKQCRTFPFWPEYTRSMSAWREVMAYCPGSGVQDLGGRSAQDRLFQELAGIYRDLDRELAGYHPRCALSGACCRFAESDHRLYTSEVEWLYLMQHAPRDIPAPTEDVCPFLHGGRCTVRKHRLLGCRVYYCDPAFAGRMSGLYEKYHQRIKKLTRKFDGTWRYFDFMACLRETLEANPSRTLRFAV